eukprot:PLAT7033.46.p1 GENE.PLAT7033.46~~PLAT7033.46.p1  ORF type:complete len:157 (-),score=64.97 PLAT7033.46:470-940(-)
MLRLPLRSAFRPAVAASLRAEAASGGRDRGMFHPSMMLGETSASPNEKKVLTLLKEALLAEPAAEAVAEADAALAVVAKDYARQRHRWMADVRADFRRKAELREVAIAALPSFLQAEAAKIDNAFIPVDPRALDGEALLREIRAAAEAEEEAEAGE